MKKHRLIAFVLSLSLLLAFTASASASTAAKTTVRGLIEFEELAMRRLTECVAQYDADNQIQITPFSGFMSETEDEYSFNSTFGYMGVNHTDFSVNYLLMTSGVVGDDKQKLAMNMYKSVSAMSALEYGVSEEDSLALRYNLGLSDTASAYDATMDIWINEMLPAISEALQKSPKKDTPVKIYSGNYDYFVQFSDSQNGLVTYVLAKKR